MLSLMMRSTAFPAMKLAASPEDSSKPRYSVLRKIIECSRRAFRSAHAGNALGAALVDRCSIVRDYQRDGICVFETATRLSLGTLKSLTTMRIGATRF
jgi:hypothetical protein